MRKKAVAYAVSFLAALGLVYCGYWFFAATTLRDGIESWVQTYTAQGPDAAAAYRTLNVDGFPAGFRVALSGVAVRGAERGGLFEWRAESLEANLGSFDFDRITLVAEGRQEIDYIDAFGRLLAASSPGPATARLSHDGQGRPMALEVDVDDLTIDGKILQGIVHIGRLEARGKRVGPPISETGKPGAARVALTARDIEFPAYDGNPFGERIDLLKGDLRINGTLIEAPPRAAAVAWRNSGGKLFIDELQVLWGPLDLALQGTMALDEALQPTGTVTATLANHPAVLEAATRQGLISEKDAKRTKMVLDLLAKGNDSEGTPRVKAPVNIRQGILFLGPVKLGRLPPIQWRQ